MDSKQIAATTLQQLGGRRAQVMIAAHCLSYDAEGSLSLRFKGSKKANHVKIILDPSDTYTMVFGKIRGTNYKVVAEYSDVYCDKLQSTFESTTELYLSL